MAKALALCALLCTLLHAGSAASLPLEANKAAIHEHFSHLQADIDLWKRLGLPTVAQFGHDDESTASLIDLPNHMETASIFSPDYEGNTHFYLFTRENQDGAQVAGDVDAFKQAGWKAERPTKVIIHGFGSNIKSPLYDTVPALLANADVNVIGVDWGKLCGSPWYTSARNHVEGVGKEVAKLLDSLVRDAGLDLSTLHVMGHSLGAHVAGNTGKHLKTGTIARITGFDPAMPLFLLFTSDRLHKEDAQLVDVVHTCGGFLGLEEAIGHVDFYPNGGTSPQPGCGWDLLGSCSHGRSYQYFRESAIEENAFPAVECASTNSATSGRCSNLRDGNMGLNLRFNPDGTGKYYLETADSVPFDLTFHSRRGSQ